MDDGIGTIRLEEETIKRDRLGNTTMVDETFNVVNGPGTAVVVGASTAVVGASTVVVDISVAVVWLGSTGKNNWSAWERG